MFAFLVPYHKSCHITFFLSGHSQTLECLPKNSRATKRTFKSPLWSKHETDMKYLCGKFNSETEQFNVDMSWWQYSAYKYFIQYKKVQKITNMYTFQCCYYSPSQLGCLHNHFRSLTAQNRVLTLVSP